MMSNRRKVLWIALAAGAAIALGITGYAQWFKDRPTRHFAVVKSGVLYRGGQPDQRGMREIISRYGIKTVVNLRGPRPGDSWYPVEKKVCKEAGLRMVDLHIGSLSTAQTGLKEFLEMATDPKCQPVFVHCEAGSARTGFAVAAYRIAVEGWKYDAAVADAKKFNFNAEANPNNREYDRLLKSLGAGADWHKLGGEAESRPTTTSQAAHP